jgi:hypothetical protein
MDEKAILDRLVSLEEKVDILLSLAETGKKPKPVQPLTHPTIDHVKELKKFLGDKYDWTNDREDMVSANEITEGYKRVNSRASHIMVSRTMMELKIKKKRLASGVFYLGFKLKA